MLPSVTVKVETMTVHPLFVLIRDNFIITIHSDEINRLLRFSRYAPQFFKRIASESTPDKITLMLERIIDENNDRNFRVPAGDRERMATRSANRLLRRAWPRKRSLMISIA